jgi:hypothetical protein
MLGTAVVNDNVLSVRVILGENTLDTFGEIWFAVVDGSDDAYEWVVVRHNLKRPLENRSPLLLGGRQEQKFR